MIALKRITSGILGIAFGLFALLCVLNLLYNLGGVIGVQDAASGPKWESALVVLACTGLALGASYLSYRLSRFASAGKHGGAK